ncbi:tyrosine-type recombinase/integrase [Sphingobacterium thalpophilum]|uniref:tyrosine-type recombinase/integrase n=1 Tax=Sphingobacterium thalpophilum TaxID=259 RepID=UPI003DA59064
MNDYSVKIKRTDDLRKRAYIEIYLEGKRIKEYTGIKLNLNIKPNSATSIAQRDELLKTLEYEFRKAIEFNHYPVNIKIQQPSSEPCNLKEMIDNAIANKKQANLSIGYVNELKSYANKFKDFLSEDELNAHISQLSRARIQEFMNRFNSSASYYMIARRHIKTIFSEISKTEEFNTSIVTNTDKRKATPKLHKVYTEQQLSDVLAFLKQHHPNLHLCCLMSYGCLLRPHNEIRLLRRSHFKNDIKEIHLSGHENKGKKIRIVPIPNYVREILLCKLEGLAPEENLFSEDTSPYNLNYFSTAWKRMFKLMDKEGIIEKNQTIYSFRHTASVNVYKKTKDLHILQQLLGHSDMIVTLKYLRGLGVHNADELKHVMPEL